MKQQEEKPIRIETRVVPVYVYGENVRQAWAIGYEAFGRLMVVAMPIRSAR